MRKYLLLAGLLLALFAAPPVASVSADKKSEKTEASKKGKGEKGAPPDDSLAAIEKKLKPQTGKVAIGNGIATLDVPAEFGYLDATQARMVIEDVWGNPDGKETLGMLVPAGISVTDPESWGVVITFEEDGFVKDDEADSINYEELLKQMQEGTKLQNEERKKLGFEPVTLVGWATKPRYDKAAHKLYWAKDLTFGDEKDHTLNYNIRILGRRGVLVLNAVAGMNQLKLIEQKTPRILEIVNFNEGHRYGDFNPKLDKVATYGLAGLITGGVVATAAKTGLLKGLWIALLGAKKLVVVAIIAIGAAISRFFKRKSE